MKPVLPRYRLLEAAYLQPARSAGASRFEAGAAVDFEGVPTFGMIPLNAPAFAAKAASIRVHGLSRLRNPSPGDRSVLQTLAKSLGVPLGTVDETVTGIEQWLAQQESAET
jgi:hypothetical protein